MERRSCFLRNHWIWNLKIDWINFIFEYCSMALYCSDFFCRCSNFIFLPMWHWCIQQWHLPLINSVWGTKHKCQQITFGMPTCRGTITCSSHVAFCVGVYQRLRMQASAFGNGILGHWSRLLAFKTSKVLEYRAVWLNLWGGIIIFWETCAMTWK